MTKLIKTFFLKFKYTIYNYFEIEIDHLLSVYGVKLTPIWNDKTFKYTILGLYGDFYKQTLEGISEPFVFVDIGANQGLYSLIAAKNKNNLKLYLIEPQERMVSILKKNLKLNNIRNYEILPVAISDTNAKVKLTNFKNHSGKSTLLNLNETENISSHQVQAINSEGLNGIFEMKSNFVVKIDVEGHEEVVIKELIKVKDFSKVYSIFYEVNIDWTNPKKIEQLLREVGYCYFKKIGKNNFHYDILASRIQI
tara:strand:- start:3543 stop:4298 length:756 start_codon:yes stop_codon:yes gene_type:complete